MAVELFPWSQEIFNVLRSVVKVSKLNLCSQDGEYIPKHKCDAVVHTFQKNGFNVVEKERDVWFVEAKSVRSKGLYINAGEETADGAFAELGFSD